VRKIITVYDVAMCWLVRPIANLRNGYRQLWSIGKTMSVRE